MRNKCKKDAICICTYETKRTQERESRGKKDYFDICLEYTSALCVFLNQLSEHSHPLEYPTSEQKWFLFIFFFTSTVVVTWRYFSFYAFSAYLHLWWYVCILLKYQRHTRHETTACIQIVA